MASSATSDSTDTHTHTTGVLDATLRICRPPSFIAPSDCSVFLSGSFRPGDDNERRHDQLITCLMHAPTTQVTIIDAWRDDYDDSPVQFKPNQRSAIQYRWELLNLPRVDVVAVYFAPDSKAPVSLLDFGLAAARDATKLVVYCEDDSHLRCHVEHICQEMHVFLVDTFDEFVRAVIDKLNKSAGTSLDSNTGL